MKQGIPWLQNASRYRSHSQGDHYSPGSALGLTQQLPMDEKHTYPKKYLHEQSRSPHGWPGGRRIGLQ